MIAMGPTRIAAPPCPESRTVPEVLTPSGPLHLECRLQTGHPGHHECGSLRWRTEDDGTLVVQTLRLVPEYQDVVRVKS